ncbi:hypothetical protein JCM15519_14830 [Fundidesulfovibrio butyratiphilus]
MASLLETLQSIDFCKLARLYELFATIYHVALDYEEELISVLEVDQDVRIARDVATLPLEEEDSPACMWTLNEYIRRNIHSERTAKLFVAALLPRLDAQLAGLGVQTAGTQAQVLPPSDPLVRLMNSNYYTPIQVEVGGSKGEYVIAPRIKPIFSRWIGADPLDYDEAYFSATISYHFLEHHTLVKDGRVNNHRVILSPGKVSRQSGSSFHRSLANLETLTIALSPMDAGFVFDVETYRKKGVGMKVPFRYVNLKSPDRDTMEEYVCSILAKAQEERVDILIFPELTVDHDALTSMVEYLSTHNGPHQLKLVVAGSFHKERPHAGYVNLATMLDWQGNVVWEHTKKRPFVLTADIIEKSPNRDFIRREFDLVAGEELVEYIHTESPVVFVDTPIGRMATVICLDMLLPSVESIISRVPCDFLFVPAMTLGIDKFHSKARDIFGGQFNMVTACCASVSCTQLFRGEGVELSFLYAPSKKFSGKHGKSRVERLDSPPLLIYRLHQLM